MLLGSKDFNMKKYLVILVFSLLCLNCKAQDKNNNNIDKIDNEDKIAFETKSGITFENKIYFETESDMHTNDIHTFEEFKNILNVELNYFLPMGTWFWDEFSDYEEQYNLTKNESKLLGRWMNVTFTTLVNNNYLFFPNKLFILLFNYKNIRIIDEEKMYFNRAIGTWEIVDGIVRFTIYAVVTEDDMLKYSNNKELFFVERPYSVDFINIDDIGEEGYTKRPINDTILSEELKRMVTIKKPNMTNNLYVRNVYSMNVLPPVGKDYGDFSIVPNLARENLSGLEVATSRELIERYIFPMWP